MNVHQHNHVPKKKVFVVSMVPPMDFFCVESTVHQNRKGCFLFQKYYFFCFDDTEKEDEYFEKSPPGRCRCNHKGQ